MSRKRRNSLSPLFAEPSAIFRTTENAARLAWEVRPYSSCFGKASVAAYTLRTSLYDSCQAWNRSEGATAKFAGFASSECHLNHAQGHKKRRPGWTLPPLFRPMPSLPLVHRRVDTHAKPPLVLVLELDDAVDQSK